MSDQEKQIDKLFEGIETLSSIRCNKCGVTKIRQSDGYDAADGFFHEGWRIMRGNCVCPKCILKKKK
jgi:hypothetical protein